MGVGAGRSEKFGTEGPGGKDTVETGFLISIVAALAG